MLAVVQDKNVIDERALRLYSGDSTETLIAILSAVIWSVSDDCTYLYNCCTLRYAPGASPFSCPSVDFPVLFVSRYVSRPSSLTKATCLHWS